MKTNNLDFKKMSNIELLKLAGIKQTEETFMELTKLENRSINYRIALNIYAPSNVLNLISKTSNTDIKLAIAQNINTSVETLEILAKDDDPDIRQAVAENASTPDNILSLLINDDEPYVRRSAMIHRDILRNSPIKVS